MKEYQRVASENIYAKDVPQGGVLRLKSGELWIRGPDVPRETWEGEGLPYDVYLTRLETGVQDKAAMTCPVTYYPDATLVLTSKAIKDGW